MDCEVEDLYEHVLHSVPGLKEQVSLGRLMRCEYAKFWKKANREKVNKWQRDYCRKRKEKIGGVKNMVEEECICEHCGRHFEWDVEDQECPYCGLMGGIYCEPCWVNMVPESKGAATAKAIAEGPYEEED